VNPSDSIFLECLCQLKADEGFRAGVYVCPAGALTIGYGRNVDTDKGGPGITTAEAEVMLSNDITTCDDDLRKLFAGWDGFGVRRRAALVNLRYQLGPHRLRAFSNMISAINGGDWPAAAFHLRDSAMYRDRGTHGRTERRAKELEQG
jgi:lysozyme